MLSSLIKTKQGNILIIFWTNQNQFLPTSWSRLSSQLLCRRHCYIHIPTMHGHSKSQAFKLSRIGMGNVGQGIPARCGKDASLWAFHHITTHMSFKTRAGGKEDWFVGSIGVFNNFQSRKNIKRNRIEEGREERRKNCQNRKFVEDLDIP